MNKKLLIILLIITVIFLGAATGIIYFSIERFDQLDDTQEKQNPQDDVSFVQPQENKEVVIDNNENYIELNPETTLSLDPVTEEAPINSDSTSYPIVLAFAGDVNLDESSKPIVRYDQENKGILGGISAELIEEMTTANIMMLNNEFAYSTRGTKTPNKSYTFRADPSRVNILHEMGVNIVSLANNHTLDYGEDALLDTLETLENAGIDYVGAGQNLDRAKAAVYYTIGDKTIAYLAASRVIFSTDWYATSTRPGMIGTYDPTLLLQCIEEAAANSDYVVVYLHWGVERNHYPEQYQKTFAKKYIDAGADAVIGCHPHVMQGIEFYKGKPIAYSLGNFWFNNTKRESGLLKLLIEADGTIKVQMLPVITEKSYTYLLTDKKEQKEYYRFMKDISFGITFDDEGFISEKAD